MTADSSRHMNPLPPVLLVEDQLNDVTLILGVLKALNFENPVHVETDGRKAIDFLFAYGAHAQRLGGDPILILLDLNLPEIPGQEIIRRMRTEKHLKNIPVVVLTSTKSEDEVRAALMAGANAVLMKPIQRHDFLIAIADLGFPISISAHRRGD